MKYVTLLEHPVNFEDVSLREVYTSKLHALQRTLLFFEKHQVEATVTFRAQVQGSRLHTAAEVECADEGFRLAIEQAVKKFNTASIAYEE